MCGIVGYIGKKNSLPILIQGLKRLEYRGYDSVGLAVINDDLKVDIVKKKGKISELEGVLKKVEIKGRIGIGHTRWATHGIPNEINAHPHFDCQKKIFVVHNGIIENYNVLREWLIKKNHQFNSETDTEVIAHLIEEYYENDLLKAVQKALSLVEGTYGLAIFSLDEPDKLIAARKGSPLLIGLIEDNENVEYIIASDPAAVIEYTRKVIYLADGEIAVLTFNGYQIRNLENIEIKKEVDEILWDLAQIEKGGFPHFMLKEIFEQPETIKNALRGRILPNEGKIILGGIKDELDFLIKAKRFVLIGCGTSWHACLVGEYLLEYLANIPTEVEYGSEFRYKNTPIEKDVAYFVISQSGETADTLESLRKIKKAGGKVFGIVNVVGSTIARETDAGIYLHAGPEIGVASTKAFTSQLTVLIELALLLGIEKGLINQNETLRRIKGLLEIPDKIKEILNHSKEIEKIAKKYYQFNNFLYLGRGFNFPTALEGALKLKEISYIHAEGYPAAEMKHGPIALIDQNMPVVVIATDTEDLIYQKVISNIEEVKARGGRVIAIATIGNEQIKRLADDVIYIPKTLGILTPLLSVIPLQLLAYYVAILRGCDVDKPRNLAKSVTVE
jgi:glucosamine--fructose-6-phosphate aminotransferase (isomerizing)